MILSIGHSNHSYLDFLDLLKGAGVTTVVDVRSSPYSRFSPHFAETALANRLRYDGIGYEWLGKELGGRPGTTDLYRAGVADYVGMARTPSFKLGIARLLDVVVTGRTAMMCSEGDPTECHRCLLVGRALREAGHAVGHIHKDGRIETQEAIEVRLIDMARPRRAGLFDAEPTLDEAYAARAIKVAYRGAGRVTPREGA